LYWLFSKQITINWQELYLFNFISGKRKNPPPWVGTSCPNPKNKPLQMAWMPDGGRVKKSNLDKP